MAITAIMATIATMIIIATMAKMFTMATKVIMAIVTTIDKTVGMREQVFKNLFDTEYIAT